MSTGFIVHRGGIDAPENLNFYGEVSVLTTEGDADNAWGTKIGAKYSF